MGFGITYYLMSKKLFTIGFLTAICLSLSNCTKKEEAPAEAPAAEAAAPAPEAAPAEAAPEAAPAEGGEAPSH